MNEVLQTPYMKLWTEENILHCVYADKLEIDIEIAKKCVAARIAYSKEVSYPCLVDVKGIRSITKEARAYLAAEGAELIKAGALVIGSALTKMLGNIFISLNKPPVPTRLFTNEKEAKEWLRQFI